MNTLFNQSAIYKGRVYHRRFTPKSHQFDYRLYMLALDLADIENASQGIGLFGFNWYQPLRFVQKDYVQGEPTTLRQRITNKVTELGGNNNIARVVMLVQVRCFGIYFSPANFYFCYDQDGRCHSMLTEVSNTPWNERHYYLVPLAQGDDLTTEKRFQVSPFMEMAMTYVWQVTPPSKDDDRLKIKIENYPKAQSHVRQHKVFDACIVLKKQPLNQQSLLKVWAQLPLMTVKIVAAIYWQALKLLVKRIPFLGYQKAH